MVYMSYSLNITVFVSDPAHRIDYVKDNLSGDQTRERSLKLVLTESLLIVPKFARNRNGVWVGALLGVGMQVGDGTRTTHTYNNDDDYTDS